VTTTRRPLAVFDLDGTLADTRHRLPFLERRPRDWNAFFAAAGRDPLLEEGAALAATWAAGCEIAYVTGRPERCRRDTQEWLERHGLPAGRVWMRAADDRRPARTTKLELLRRLARHHTVEVVVDDDELVCAACERAGFRVVRAGWMAALPELRAAQEREGRT
jgi:phosphoglycolate phosphatase-like HAD superfamily hydrolase